jgi:hypothetical protein
MNLLYRLGRKSRHTPEDIRMSRQVLDRVEQAELGHRLGRTCTQVQCA